MPLEAPHAGSPHRPDGRAEPAGHRARPGAAVPDQARRGSPRAGDDHQRPDGRAWPCRSCSAPAARRAGRMPRPSTAAFGLASACWSRRRTTTAAGAGPARRRPATATASARVVWALSLAARPAIACPTTRSTRRLGYLHEPGRRHGRRRLREQGDPAARPVGGRPGRLRPGQPALSQPARAFARRPGPPARWPLPRWTASRLAGELSGPAGQAESRRRRAPRRNAAMRFAALEPFPGRAAGAVRPGAAEGLARSDPQGQGTGRLAAGPSHGPPLVARQGHRPGGAGPVPVVRREPLRGRALPAGRFVNDVEAKCSTSTQDAGRPDGRRAGQAAEERASSGSTSRSTGRGRYTLPVHPGRVRAGRQAEEHDQRLERAAALRAGAAGIGRPGDPPRLRRAGGQLLRRSATRLTQLPVGRRGRVELDDLASRTFRPTRPKNNSSTSSSPSRSPAAPR